MCKTMSERFLDMKKLSTEEKTIKAYTTDLRCFYEFMKDITKEEDEIKMLKKINGLMVQDFIDKLVYELRYSITTINRYISTIKMFDEYLCITARVIDYRFAEGLKAIKENRNSPVKPREEKEALTIDDYNSLIKASYIRKKGDREFEFNSSRFRFMLSLAISTGLRIEQLLGIRESNLINKKNYLVLVLEAETNKTDKPIRVPICGKAFEFYKEYFTELNKLNKKDEDYLFISNRGKKIDTKAANVCLKKVAEIAEIGKNLSFHCCRGSFKTIATKKGMNRDLIDLCGGWKLQGISSVYCKDGENLDEDKKLWIEKILN